MALNEDQRTQILILLELNKDNGWLELYSDSYSGKMQAKNGSRSKTRTDEENMNEANDIYRQVRSIRNNQNDVNEIFKLSTKLCEICNKFLNPSVGVMVPILAKQNLIKVKRILNDF
jgi:hypothetical protein